MGDAGESRSAGSSDAACRALGSDGDGGAGEGFTLKNFIDQIFQLLFRMAMLLAGLVFFASLLVVAGSLLGLWLLRALWARVTGQPVSPWVFKVDPRAQWNRFNRAPGDGGAGRADSGNGADIEDVVARDIEPPDTSKAKMPDRSL